MNTLASCFCEIRALCGKKRADLELLLQLTVETRQHRVGFLVFADGHLDLPLLPG